MNTEQDRDGVVDNMGVDGVVWRWGTGWDRDGMGQGGGGRGREVINIC